MCDTYRTASGHLSGYEPPAMFICAMCSIEAHDLCSSPSHVACVCEEVGHVVR